MTVSVLLLLVFFLVFKVISSDSVLHAMIGLDFLSSMVFMFLFTMVYVSVSSVLASIMFVTLMAVEGVMGLGIISSSIIRLESSSFKLLSCSKM